MSSKAGSAAASAGEQDAIRLISDAGLPIETCTFVRAVTSDIDYAADNGADSVHLVIPTSDLHIEKKMRKTREEVAEMAWGLGRVREEQGAHCRTVR